MIYIDGHTGTDQFADDFAIALEELADNDNDTAAPNDHRVSPNAPIKEHTHQREQALSDFEAPSIVSFNDIVCVLFVLRTVAWT